MTSTRSSRRAYATLLGSAALAATLTVPTAAAESLPVTDLIGSPAGEVAGIDPAQAAFDSIYRRGRTLELHWTSFTGLGSALTGHRVTGLPGGTRLLPAEARQIKVRGLVWGQAYTVALTGLTDLGASDPVTYAFTMPTLKPTRARAVAAITKGRRVIVTWKASRERGTPVTGYRVTVLGLGRTVEVGPKARRAVIRGVRPGPEVRVRVKPTSALG